MQHARETTKQIIDINTKTAQTLKQNTRQMTAAASRYISSFSTNTNSPAGTTASSSTTSSITSAA